MTTVHHVPHTYRADLTSVEVNRPLSELDAAIETVIATGSGTATTLTALAGAGQASLTVASSAGFAVGDPIYIGKGAPADSRIIATAGGTTITVTVNLATTFAAGAPVSKSPVEIVAARGGFTTLGGRIGQIESREFDVRVYGALGGATDDTTAVQATIDAASVNGGTVIFPFMSRVSALTVTAPNVHLLATNGGGILDGTVRIGVATGTQLAFDGSIRGIKFTRGSPSTTVNAIELVNVLRVTIDSCFFGDYNAGIYVIPRTGGVHVAQVTASNCRSGIVPTGGRPRYFLLAPQPGDDTATAADTTLIGNIISSLITNVSVYGPDGIVIEGNTFFMPGAWEASATKERNIAITGGSGVIITGNRCFEAGLEAIRLVTNQDFTITGNSLVWPGQRVMSSAINITGGDNTGGHINRGTISGNTSLFPTLHGIFVQSPCGNIVITGNMIRSAGYDGGTYYGTPALGTVNHYGIAVESTTQEMLITGNLCPGNQNAIITLGANSHSANNLASDGVY
jgi:hypothetical protein